MRIHTDFVLASQSPRRRKLLRQMGIPFFCIPAKVDETAEPARGPRRLVESLALKKATSVVGRKPSALILGADTIVAYRGLILGKPSGAVEAAAMLRQLSASTHTVYTGIALIHADSDRKVTDVESTEVTFGRLSETEISNYIKTGSPLDKAGAYGIQDDMGAMFVKRISGDFYNVVGLPIRRLYILLNKHFSDLIEL